MPNRLADSLSPYLLQHQDNPVDWYPWGEDAFTEAKRSDRPIFLSVGYAACHWCHVMEHESFEDEEIAAFLNQHFVSIKVDREERPDVDQIYMNAVQVMTGHGGWPMSVFLDHQRRPFYAGTYWPPSPRAGMPGFPQVLQAIADAWADKRDEVREQSESITKALQQIAEGTGTSNEQQTPASDPDLATRIVRTTCDQLVGRLDRSEGGFGAAPKFPHATDLMLLLSRVAIEPNPDYLHAVELTLQKMSGGGIFDHIGGGFARYSVDAKWLVPHFEKMLYDNALLAETYTRAYQVTGDDTYADTARRTLDYLLREMRDPMGGFHCSEDADSEGVEGKFYVWTPAEVIGVLGEERARVFCEAYDITERGNFEGASIPHLAQPLSDEDQARQFAEDRERLRVARDRRVHPGRDDKVITGWNALAIRSFAIAGVALEEDRYIQAAVNAAQFIDTTMRDERGRLLHAFRDGKAHLDAYIDDYALTAAAFVAVYQATGDAGWIHRAEKLADTMAESFWDENSGGFYYTADDAETLITRNKDWHDGSLVSGNGAAVDALLTLSILTGRDDFRELAARTLNVAAEVLINQSAAAASLVLGLDRLHQANRQWVLALPAMSDVTEWRAAFYKAYRPHTVSAWHIEQADIVNLAEGKICEDNRPTLYQCENFTCRRPVTGDELKAALESEL